MDSLNIVLSQQFHEIIHDVAASEDTGSPVTGEGPRSEGEQGVNGPHVPTELAGRLHCIVWGVKLENLSIGLG